MFLSKIIIVWEQGVKNSEFGHQKPRASFRLLALSLVREWCNRLRRRTVQADAAASRALPVRVVLGTNSMRPAFPCAIRSARCYPYCFVLYILCSELSVKPGRRRGVLLARGAVPLS